MTVLDNRELLRRSNAYYTKGALDVETWAKIASVPDYEQAIDAYDWVGLFEGFAGKEAISILDFGCGVGHFPRLLGAKIGGPVTPILDYDTVDASSYSLAEHRRNLGPPFNPR